MGTLARAAKNISRRKIRTFLVVIALGFSVAIMLSIPAGIMANQESTQRVTENFSGTITAIQEEIKKTASLIECSTIPSQGMQGFRIRGFYANETFIDETVMDVIRSIEGVKDVIPFLEKSSSENISETINTPFGSRTIYRPDYTIMGVCLNSSIISNYSILPTNITAGETLSEGDYHCVLLSSNLTEYFGADIGDVITYKRR